ncbi:MAG: PIN domain nuclease [Acidobacteriota bacterium]|nr:PIN domain nuclease [Acidobacteriota bacterium]
MILVDTSIWIGLLNGWLRKRVSPDDMAGFLTCGPIVQEVLQGLRDAPASQSFRLHFLELSKLSDPLPMSIFLAAAEIYRDGRAKGVTIRSSTDCLIAAIAIENDVPIWHRDRDFSEIAKYTRLKVVARH